MAYRPTPEDRSLLDKLRALGQAHVEGWLGALDEGAGRRLMAQLREVDPELLAAFRERLASPPAGVGFADVAPAPVAELPRSDADRRAESRVIEAGRQALRADRVACLTVAGGQGTRLGYDHPKGMFPITPVLGKSLFQYFAEHILAARRRYGARLPWLIMTSRPTDAETRDFFRAHAFFGLGEETVHFFVQQDNPVLDPQGRLLRADADRLLVGPDGHGGTLTALARSGLLEVLEKGGWDLISYFQVDNPLAPVADPRFIGYHLDRRAEFSCKVVTKRDPQEGLGIAVLVKGRPAVIEYVDVPAQEAARLGADGRLKYLFGSIAVHILDVPFVGRAAGQVSRLPWHVAEKQYEIVNGQGKRVKPAGKDKNGRKFERFIFDAIPLAGECAFVEVEREQEFGPVKNAQGDDSPATARQLLRQQWLRWLREAGAPCLPAAEGDYAAIEISPLYAADAEHLRERVQEGREPRSLLALEP